MFFDFFFSFFSLFHRLIASIHEKSGAFVSMDRLIIPAMNLYKRVSVSGRVCMCFSFNFFARCPVEFDCAIILYIVLSTLALSFNSMCL